MGMLLRNEDDAMSNKQHNFFEQTETQHGFIKLLFKDSYDNLCSLQESSNAEDDFIWLGIENAEPLIMEQDAVKLGLISKDRPTAGWVDYPIPEEVLLHTRMHLSKEQATILGLKLLHFGTSGDISERTSE